MAVDFEFEFGGHSSFEEANRSGERPRPICMVAKELRSGQTWRLWRGEFGSQAPFPTDPDAVLVVYYASAEFGCFRAKGWRPPIYVLDLFTEFRARTNGLILPHGAGLLGALTYFGLDGVGLDKDGMRLLALRGGPWSDNERAALLHYCETDVPALERLLPTCCRNRSTTRPVARAFHEGRCRHRMEWDSDRHGYPGFRAILDRVQDDLIAAIDRNYGVFDGRSFRSELWAQFLAAHNIPWPTHETGRLDLSDETFRQMAKAFPIVSPIRELRSASVRVAPRRFGGWFGWSKSDDPVSLPGAHGALSAEQYPIHLRPQCVVARPDQAG